MKTIPEQQRDQVGSDCGEQEINRVLCFENIGGEENDESYDTDQEESIK